MAALRSCGFPVACLSVTLRCAHVGMRLGGSLPANVISCHLPFLATVKKSIRLREEMQAKEPVKATNSQSSAEKLRKILKEEKR